MSELILYAVPRGELGAQLDACWAAVRTEAQRYPPHCTLTGFFHDGDVARYAEAAGAVVAPCAARVVSLREGDLDGRWIGLELDAPDLRALTDRFATAVAAPQTRTDAIRVKEWLHVSIAYGHDGAEHGLLLDRARSIVDPGAAAEWELRLYERLPGDEWDVRGRWPLAG